MAVVTKNCYNSNTSKIVLFDFYSSSSMTSSKKANSKRSSSSSSTNRYQKQSRIDNMKLEQAKKDTNNKPVAKHPSRSMTSSNR